MSAPTLVKPVLRVPPPPPRRARRRASRTVVLLGLTSLFTDKEVAATGYGISALCKLALTVVGTGVSAIGTIVLLDRIGKGFRTAPRDAMISLSVPRSRLGAAFGLHRALDTTGAMLGPLVAFGLLALAPLAFQELFVAVGAVFMALAAPLGRLADHVGRARVLIGGYGLLLAAYAVLLSPLGGWTLAAAALALLGAYYAATDGVLMALASGVVPEEVRGSGLALLKTATSGARFFASVLFGAAWALWGVEAALLAFGAALLAATALAGLSLRAPR